MDGLTLLSACIIADLQAVQDNEDYVCPLKIINHIEVNHT